MLSLSGFLWKFGEQQRALNLVSLELYLLVVMTLVARFHWSSDLPGSVAIFVSLLDYSLTGRLLLSTLAS